MLWCLQIERPEVKQRLDAAKRPDIKLQLEAATTLHALAKDNAGLSLWPISV